MKREQQKSQQLLKLTHQLKEWEDNVALDVQKKYTFTATNQRECSQQQLEVSLPLDHQHKLEWETLAAVEAESWCALGKQHQHVIMQLRSAKASWSQQVTVLKEQLVEIQCLHRANQQKRASLQQRQAMDKKLSSSGPIDASTSRIVN